MFLIILSPMSFLSSDPKTQMVMIEEGGLEVLLNCMTNKCEDVHRCAITGLANLSKNRAASCRKIVKNNGVHAVLRYTTSPCVQVVRESARFLANIAETRKLNVKVVQ